MAWFKKKPSELERLANIADDVQAIAKLRFSAHGMPVSVREGSFGTDAVLVSPAGAEYPLHNLITRALAGDLDDVARLVNTHVDGLVDAAKTPTSDELGDSDWLELSRVRLMPLEAATTLGADYAREVPGGLAVMPCLDYPTHISFLSDSALEHRDPVELAAAGLAAVMAEPVEEARALEGELWLIAGDSPYTATKVLGMQHLVGDVLPTAPHGVVFGIPHRHAIIAHVVTGADAMTAVSNIAALVESNATDSAPGGPLSTSLFYWNEGVIDLLGWVGENGNMQIDGSGRFGDTVARLNG